MHRIHRSRGFAIPALLQAVVLLLSSCSLFVDELDSEDGEFRNVPVHTGEGYDAPLSVHSGGCDVTYQYNSCVRLLEPDVQDRFIVSAERDALNAFIEIHYRRDTPAELLPVDGEILVSGVTEKFPWGCNHRVQYRIEEGGVYKYIVTFATLEETFKELDINGTMTTTETEEYWVRPLADDYLDGNSDDPGDMARSNATRADGEGEGNGEGGGEGDDGEIEVKFEASSFTTNLPISFHTAVTLPKGVTAYFDMDKEKNFEKITNQFIFSNFSISQAKFEAKVIQTVEEQNEISIKGAFSKSFRIHRWRPIKGKVFTIGPVVLVLYMNIDLSASIVFEASATITRHKITETTYKIDFRECSMTQSTRVIKNKEWDFGEVALTASFDLKLQFIFGLGIYGKIISVRLIPTFDFIAAANSLPVKKDAQGNDISDISGQEGLEVRVDLSVMLGAFLDLSLKNILGNWKQTGDAATRQKLKELEMDAKEKSIYYQSDIDIDNALYDPNKKQKGKDGKEQKEGEDELGISHVFNIGTIVGPKRIPWFPKIDDNSFAMTNEYDEQTGKMTFNAMYKIGKEGIFAAMGKQFVPALALYRGGKHFYTLFPDEGGENAKVKTGKLYTFRINAVEDNKQYEARPCYYKLPINRSTPDALDKGLPFCATSPSISLTEVRPLRVEVEKSEDSFIFDDEGKGHKYRYTFYVDTYVSVKGLNNMDYWYIYEYTSGTSYRNKNKNVERLRDATYVAHWVFIKYSDKSWTQGVNLEFYATFSTGGVVQTGSDICKLLLSSKGIYSIEGGDSGTFPVKQ